ncbi:MAG: hypothetical protein RIC36_02345 [Rhodospirillales bacterium]
MEPVSGHNSSLRLLICCLCAAFLAACGDLPKPFSERARLEINPLVRLKDSPGIFIQPVAGMSEAASDALRNSIKDHLFAHNVPSALETGSQYQYKLLGTVQADPDPGLMIRMQITWRLFDPTGLEVDRFLQAIEAEHLSWVIHEPVLMNKIADVVAAEISPSVQDEEVKAAKQPEDIRIYAEEVTGAPGTGNRDLTVSMRAALRQKGFLLADSEKDAAYFVQGAVEMSPAGERAEDVSIRWHLVRAESGELLGTVSQGNRVPKGALDGRWGALAFDIVKGSLEGLQDVLKQDGVITR